MLYWGLPACSWQTTGIPRMPYAAEAEVHTEGADE
jgi:hypothetical protein